MPIYTDIYPYDAPEGAIDLAKEQFHRMKITIPRPEVLDNGICFVVEYVGTNGFFPASAKEALEYMNNPRACKWRIEELMGPIEVLIKAKCFITDVTTDQLACMIYGALLFSWSEEGEEYVRWFSQKGMGEALHSAIL